MDTLSLESVMKVVREVLRELGVGAKEAAQPVEKKGPRVLFVFHSGVRRLDVALEQVRLIEASPVKCGVYTVSSARNRVCGGDVREKAGSQCILDTVKPEGLEKVLLLSDILVLPTFCLKTAAKLARLICDDDGSSVVLSALLQGKRILASRDGFLLCDALGNDKIRDEVEGILAKLQSFGMVFCPTDMLHETFQAMMSEKKEKIAAAAGISLAAPGLRLVTSKEVYAAVEAKQKTICLAANGRVTPLARDLAKEYSLEIVGAAR
ncbi:MAG: hypothetical protein P4L43_13135 [Syntrophobacteraceae bacterium]|nr:hypothetical protein [Syntrophobacteraceae bacterium]